jgi:hypothetical protein
MLVGLCFGVVQGKKLKLESSLHLEACQEVALLYNTKGVPEGTPMPK